MVYCEFKIDISFDGKYRDYMAIVAMVYYEFKLGINFDAGYEWAI